MRVSLSFLSDLPLYKEEKPYTIHGTAAEGLKNSNCEFTVFDDIEVEDVRGEENSGNFLERGFQFKHHASKVPVSSSDFQSPGPQNELVQLYLEETIELAKAETEATKVILFDWRVRSSASRPDAASEIPDSDRSQFLAPASIAHSDYSYNGGLARLRRQLSHLEAQEYDLERWHIRIVNVWRPLIEKVYDAPLTFCDRRSVQQDDLLEEDKVHPTHWEEGLYLIHRDDQKWYWLSEQTRDEVAIFMTWNSEDGDNLDASVCPPHASFQNPQALLGCPARESVEVRLMTFTKRRSQRR